MMNAKNLFLPIRTYTNIKSKFMKYPKNVNNANPGMDNRIKLYQDDELATEFGNASQDFDEIHEEFEQLESDFMHVGKSHKVHERELKIQKEKLKNQITFNKYVKEVEPSFLTFAEKEQIKSLHESDPHVWSVENLSESFPALPHTIRKVLHAKWAPKSVETIFRYDEKVIRNWEDFRAGELTLNPAMERHLENFRDRKIIPTDKEMAKRFVPAKMEFPKPKSKLFSTIAETFLLPSLKVRSNSCDGNDRSEVNTETCTGIENKINEGIYVNENYNSRFERKSEENIREDFVADQSARKVSNSLIHGTKVTFPREGNKVTSDLSGNNEKWQNNRLLTFNEFLKESANRATNSNSPESIVLKETYKRHVENTAFFESKPAVGSSEEIEDEEMACNFQVSKGQRQDNRRQDYRRRNDRRQNSLKGDKKESELSMWKSGRSILDSGASSSIQKSQTDQILKQENGELSSTLDHSSLDTCVKEWLKKVDDYEIPHFIKIPKHRYKSGMTYRVKNCFYDDDGEFLYRVPGLYN